MKIFSSQVLAQGLRVLLLNDFQFNKKPAPPARVL
jgi:hypothetical protein